MRHITFAIIFFVSFNALAGIPKSISYEEASKMGISISIWEGYSQQEKALLQESYACTPVTIYVPVNDIERPENGIKFVEATLKKANKVLMSSTLVLHKNSDDGKTKAKGCLPLLSSYQVDIQITYSQEGLYQMCPPQYLIENVSNFFNNSDYNAKKLSVQ